MWSKIQIKRENGELVDAQAPVIISASRSTDIPAFYADWFFNRLKKGYCSWMNPFNGKPLYVSFQNTRFIVFWSKNPGPLLNHFDELDKMDINCYIQYTLNDYEREGLEKGVPPLTQRIDTFKALVDRLGFGKVIWRFDPLILTDKIGVDDLLQKVENIGDQLKGYTEKLVFSFADISSYKKVKVNLEKNHVNYVEFTEYTMNQMAKGLCELNKSWGYELATCAERIDLEKYGIAHNRCIDDRLMVKYFSHDLKLMEFLGAKIISPDMFNPEPQIIFAKNNKDKGQRLFCGCINSKDIGQYNTCPHLCEYCYANTTKAEAVKNYKLHQAHSDSENIIGEP
jgi:DNA repair photolyase